MLNRMNIITTYTTDTGTAKKINQDSLCVKEAQTPLGLVVMSVLCDGLGGMDSGEIASTLVVHTFSQWFEQVLPKYCAEEKLDHILKSWEILIRKLNDRVVMLGEKSGSRMGTTLSVLLIIEDIYYGIAHVGDTRIYCLKKEKISILTRDDTWLCKALAEGWIEEKDASTYPRRHALTQCIGNEQGVIPQLITGVPERDCTYVLCSDGFRNEVTSEEIYEHLNIDVLTDIDVMKTKAAMLVELNKQRNETDNISVIIMKVKK